MASNPVQYNIDNEPLDIKNVIKYLYCLKLYQIIPHFNLDITDKELNITTIYSPTSTNLPFNGYTVITYNIYTKKWKGVINLNNIENGSLVNKTYLNLKNNFPFVIDNDLLSIKYEHPYAEHIIESEYLEDVLEPSLNVFRHNLFNPRNINSAICFATVIRNGYSITYNNIYGMDYAIEHYHNGKKSDIQNFHRKIEEHENYLMFMSKKDIIKKSFFLPEELWRTIYKFYQ